MYKFSLPENIQQGISATELFELLDFRLMFLIFTTTNHKGSRSNHILYIAIAMFSLKIPHVLHGHQGQHTAARTTDFSQGPLLQQIVFFVIPLFSSMLLQLTFHAADLIVVGRYASSQAMAAVGSTTAVLHLFINILLGLSTGAAVITSQSFGA